jgi:hypothetical protein
MGGNMSKLGGMANMMGMQMQMPDTHKNKSNQMSPYANLSNQGSVHHSTPACLHITHIT